MNLNPFRSATLSHGTKTRILMVLVLTPVVVVNRLLPLWLFLTLFLGLFLTVIVPYFFGRGPIGWWLGSTPKPAPSPDRGEPSDWGMAPPR